MNVWHKKRKNKRKMKELLSSLNIGIRNAKRFCYILYIIVGVILMLCGIIGITIALFKQQSVPFYLFLFFISLFGFFAFYRGWIGNKAYKQLPLPKDNKSWVVFRSYPLSFWSYISRAFFNPKDMGLPVGIIIFYFLFFSIEIVIDKKEITDYSTFIIICAVFLIWKAVLFFFHWKLWRTIWYNGPLFSKLSDEGFSFVMPYNVDDDGEVILMDDDRFDTWDDNNHCLVTDHVDWKDIQRVDFFKTYVKLCTYWRSYYVFYDDNKEHSDMIHQIVALNFLKNKEDYQKYTINNINPLFQKLERSSVSWYYTDEGDYITGDSKLFGEPDVPADFKYPTIDGDRPMTFVFQLNLKDIATYDTEHILPSSGMLYFFYDYDGLESEELSAGHINDWWYQKGNDGYFRIIYSDCSRNELCPSNIDENGQRIVFKTEKTLPDYIDIYLLHINVEEDSYQWMADAYCSGEYPKPQKENWAGSMLGHAEYLEDSVIGNWENEEIEVDDIQQYYNNYVLLFQLDFNLEVPSRLYCYIPRLDLQNKNFSNVYFELQEAISKYE